jgi:hypothetical protein
MHINELPKILNQYFNFNKARSDCFAQLVIAMVTVKTVNFTHLATSFMTQALAESCYKRIQRFFRYHNGLIACIRYIENRETQFVYDKAIKKGVPIMNFCN